MILRFQHFVKWSIYIALIDVTYWCISAVYHSASYGLFSINNNYANTECSGVLKDTYSACSEQQMVARLESAREQDLSKW